MSPQLSSLTASVDAASRNTGASFTGTTCTENSCVLLYTAKPPPPPSSNSVSENVSPPKRSAGAQNSMDASPPRQCPSGQKMLKPPARPSGPEIWLMMKESVCACSLHPPLCIRVINGAMIRGLPSWNSGTLTSFVGIENVGCVFTGTTRMSRKCGIDRSWLSFAKMRKRAMPLRNCATSNDSIPSPLTWTLLCAAKSCPGASSTKSWSTLFSERSVAKWSVHTPEQLDEAQSSCSTTFSPPHE
mmetsp:Transcript_5888/g.14327  ORF Transcript_5888/g.14327 Transcript_5888/m.14327 type:complete len:244 (+) Transcript_5888:2284-3015(+)